MSAGHRPDRQWFAALFDDLYRALAGLDTAGYRWLDSDRWNRARSPLASTEPGLHLESWIDLGGISEISGSYLTHDSSLIYAVRYQDDDDSLSQSILHASIRDAILLLMAWARPDGTRTRPTGSDVFVGILGNWSLVEIQFSTRLPWRA